MATCARKFARETANFDLAYTINISVLGYKT